LTLWKQGLVEHDPAALIKPASSEFCDYYVQSLVTGILSIS
jgi:hypothetical protein